MRASKIYAINRMHSLKGVRDLYLVKIARIGNKAEIHPETKDTAPRLVFEMEFLESLPEYVDVRPNIMYTYRDTLLGTVTPYHI